MKPPTHTHPIVVELWNEMVKQQIGTTDLEDRTGLGRGTIRQWFKRKNPNIVNIEACFNVLGKTLRPVAKREEL